MIWMNFGTNSVVCVAYQFQKKEGSPGNNGTFWKSIQRRLKITFIHSYYIMTISKIVVSIVCYRFIASSHWIPTLMHQGLFSARDYYWITCCNISQDRRLSITWALAQAVPSQHCTPKFITSFREDHDEA